MLSNLSLFFLFLTTDADAIATYQSEGPHAIYISVIQIEHHLGERLGRVTFKVFRDDMEDALKNKFDKRVNFPPNKDCEINKSMVAEYFEEYFSITIDGVVGTIRFSDCEQIGDSLWFYFALECPGTWDEVTIKADYLMELFPTQTNVVYVTDSEEKRFMKLTKSETSNTVKFSD